MDWKRRFVWQDLVETAASHAERRGQTTLRTALLEPGWWALLWHRVSKTLWEADLRFLAVWLSGHARRSTGIDIHPAARIGRRCLLLGPSIIIGEMTVIGDDCHINAGVIFTSGGSTPYQLLKMDSEPLPGRGHPTIGNRCRLEAGVIVQGDVFVGDDTRLHCGATITRDVPDASTAFASATRVFKRSVRFEDLDALAIRALAQRLRAIEEDVQILNFAARRHSPFPKETRNSAVYGPIPEVERLNEGAGLE
ncbi:MAG: hypothetical protein VKN33_02100 [Candidatus Sericytochromatia bacterium]|nr:hypothetical protein [Candidatus Sericytochromatia bacterium]